MLYIFRRWQCGKCKIMTTNQIAWSELLVESLTWLDNITCGDFCTHLFDPPGIETTGSLQTLLSHTHTLCSSGTSWQPGLHSSLYLRSVFLISDKWHQREGCILNGILHIVSSMIFNSPSPPICLSASPSIFIYSQQIKRSDDGLVLFFLPIL